jgi:hypothetical protein
MRKRYVIFADYFQFYLWDREMAPEAPTDYSDEDTKRRIKTGANVVVVQSARNMKVPVELEVLDAAPSDDLADWDHVAEASLELPSGKLQLHECTGGPIDDIDVAPGTYRVRAYYGRLDDLSANGLDGNDHYRIALWRAPLASIRVLKQHETAA